MVERVQWFIVLCWAGLGLKARASYVRNDVCAHRVHLLRLSRRVGTATAQPAVVASVWAKAIAFRCIYTLKTVAFYEQNQIDTRLMQVFTPSPSLLRQCPDCQARYHLNHLSWPGYAIPVYTTYE